MTQDLFASVYKAYFGRVYHYLLSLCREHHLAEELTAETFFKAMTALKDFRGECDIGAWLCIIARNQYFSHLRKQPHVQPLEEAFDLADPKAPDPALLAEQADTAMGMYARLHDLPEPYKEVFLLRAPGPSAPMFWPIF